jgi:nicotinate-nucleotide adenylyltransferase
MARAKRIVAIFGGSFNPPHVAHVLAATAVLLTYDVDALLVVPTFQHPFAKSLAPYEHRVKMCELGMGWLPKVSISRVEEELGGESRSLRTVEHLARIQPDWELRFVIGSDILLEARKWHGFDAICALAPLIVLGRIGFDGKNVPPALLPDVSSTEVRAALAAGDYGRLAALVPREVLAYIQREGLYR